MRNWEVFNPMTGTIKHRVPFQWIARMLANGSLDYARKGEGYI
jgi:hypothetical protein